MPRIVSLQALWWGLLPATPIPLAPDRVNALIGANGSSKSTLLDAIKLLLGQTKFDAGEGEESRTAAGYILSEQDEDETELRTAEFALVAGVFLNPADARGQRPFASARPEAAYVDEVTVIARVTPDRVEWTVLDGARIWGEGGRDTEADARQIAELPAKNWHRQARHERLLSSAGFSRSMRQVIGVGQGRASAALHGDERERLRHIARLLGNEQALAELESARAMHKQTKADVDRADDELGRLEREVQATRVLAAEYGRWADAEQRLAHLSAGELPRAARLEHAAIAEQLSRLDEELVELRQRSPQLESDLAQARRRQRTASGARAQAEERREAAVRAHESAITALDVAERAIAAAPHATEDQLGQLTQQADQLARETGRLHDELDRLEAQRRELAAGRRPVPSHVASLLASLGAENIEASALADVVEPQATSQAQLEARLGDAVWAVGVPAQRFDEACELARSVPGGPPVVCLAADITESFGAFVEELATGPGDALPEGALRGRTFFWQRASEPPVLGAGSRERLLQEVDTRLAAHRPILAERSKDAQTAITARDVAQAALSARAELPRLQASVTDALEELVGARSADEAARSELELQARRIGDLEEEKRNSVLLQDERNRDRRRAADQERKLQELLTSLAGEGAGFHGPLRPLSSLQEQRSAAEQTITQTSPEARDEALPSILQRQEAELTELRGRVDGGPERVAAVNTELERHRRLFDEHVRGSIRRLGQRFTNLCAEVGMQGQIEIVEPDDDEFGIRIWVQANGGRRRVRMGSGKLSGGQQAKVALILLLACMTIEDSVDLLISDEPGAHLDARNLRDIGEAMQRSSEHVQVILAAPADAESRRMHWSGHVLLFSPIEPGEPGYPFVQIAVLDRELG